MQKIHKQDWFLIEKISGASPILLAGTFKEMTKWFYDDFKIPFSMKLLYKKNTLYLYFLRRQLCRTSNIFFKKALEDIGFLDNVDKKNKAIQKKMFIFSDKLAKINFTKISDQKLLSWYKEYVFLFEKAVAAGWVDNVLEFENESFSGYLRDYLAKKIKAIDSSDSAAEVFIIFSTPNKKTRGILREEALEKIVKKIRGKEDLKKFFLNNSVKKIEAQLNKLDEEIYKSIVRHTNKYGWNFFMYEGPAWSIIDFIKALKYSLKKELNNKKTENISIAKKALLKKLKIDKKHEKLLNQAAEIVFNKDLRKHSIYYACFSSFNLLNELAKRIGVSLRGARCILPWELDDAGIKKLSEINLKAREKGLLIKFTNGQHRVAGQIEADIFFKAVEKKEEKTMKTEMIKGSCAYPGKIQGIIKIINSPKEIKKIKTGNILVAHQTDPDILPAMKMAAAFITDLGGITCHAAIVSREMKKPCVVGTKIATKILHDGDLVEVDAERGIVQILKKAKK